jgi:hypothetical protein
VTTLGTFSGHGLPCTLMLIYGRQRYAHVVWLDGKSFCPHA